MTSKPVDHDPWPQRLLFLPLLGAFIGLCIHALVDSGINDWTWTQDGLRIAGATALAVGGITFALTVERSRWMSAAVFGLSAGLVAGAISYWSGSPGGGYSGSGWQLASALLAIVIAAPLFQAARDNGRWTLEPGPIHGYAWGNLVLWCAAWAFVIVTWLLAQLLAELFSLIGIKLLRDLLRGGWFTWMLIGAALGAAIGLLRDRDTILGLLQRTVTTILSVLAPILAAGLLLFVLALPFTGLEPLWAQTAATTPILLCCVIGAIFLANATIGNNAEDEARSPLFRLSARALCALILPLAIVAAISTWLRIDQHGFTPERLWGLTFVTIILVISAAYCAALILGRKDWPEHIRASNVGLMAGLCAVALLLATPLIDFGAVSARNQIARLENGKVPEKDFDWGAMAFDFGPAGRASLERLAKEGATGGIRAEAAKALRIKDRWQASNADGSKAPPRSLAKVRVLPRSVPLPDALTLRIAEGNYCNSAAECAVYYEEGSDWAAVLQPSVCEPGTPCNVNTALLRRNGKTWLGARDDDLPGVTDKKRDQSIADGLRSGAVEVRQVQRKQIHVGGQPVGAPFE